MISTLPSHHLQMIGQDQEKEVTEVTIKRGVTATTEAQVQDQPLVPATTLHSQGTLQEILIETPLDHRAEITDQAAEIVISQEITAETADLADQEREIRKDLLTTRI